MIRQLVRFGQNADHSELDGHFRVPDQDLNKRGAEEQSLLYLPQNCLQTPYSHFYAQPSPSET